MTKSALIFGILVALLAFLNACDTGVGQDSLTSETTPTSSATFPACVTCHSTSTTNLRQVMGTAGDFGQNAGKVSHHITGSGDPSPEQCLVCHDLSSHTLGTVLLRHADTGAIIPYDPVAPSSLESFCLSCHDDNGATATHVAAGSALEPFDDNSTLGSPPYPYATRIARSWSGPYGHGPNGNHAAGAKLTCFGTGEPGTGCHGNNGSVNAHGSSKELFLSSTFKFDYELSAPDISGNRNRIYRETQFSLCFNCHDSYPDVTKQDTLGVKQNGILDVADVYKYGSGIRRADGSINPPYYTPGVTTHFVDHTPAEASCKSETDVAANLHWFHLGIGLPNEPKGSVCITCHDVHGSTISYGAVYQELAYSNGTCGSNKYGELLNGSAFFSNYPTFCAVNCHVYMPATKAWYFPITE